MSNNYGYNSPKNHGKKSVNTYMPATKKQKTRKIFFIITALFMAVLFFFGGAATVWLCLDEEIRTLVKVKNTIDREYYKEIDDGEFYGAIFDAVNDQLDPYSYYMSAEEYAQSTNNLNGRRIGMGLSFYTADIQAGHIKIARVCGNSPAEAAGLSVGSYITGFGKTQTAITQSESYTDFSAFLGGMRESEPFYLQVKTGEEMKLVQITMEAYVENYVFYRSKTTSYGFSGEDATTLTAREDPLTCLPNDTAYIRLVQFGGEAVESFGIAMSVFKQENKKNLVLDLRGNGGGYMNTMQGLASYFCKTSKELFPVAQIADYGEREERYLASGNYFWDYFTEDSRICILADSGSASASECLIGVMLDYGACDYSDICLSERNGIAKTYGKGIMQAHFPLVVDGDIMKLTTAQIRWPITKTSIHDRGVLPEDGAKTIAEGVTDEEELAAAIEVLFG